MRTLCLWLMLLVPLPRALAALQPDSIDAEIHDDALVETEALSESFAENGPQSESFAEEPLQTRVKGFLDTYHAMRTEGACDWMASRTRVRGELTLEKGPASLYVSLNATYNALLKDRTGLELREAYLAWNKGALDLRVGRQIVVWGVADALRVTDCVSPFDYTEFLARDYDDIRMPDNLIRVRYVWGSVTLEALCCPVPEYFILPTDADNPWSVHLPHAPLPYSVDLESGKPSKRIRNMEFGGRVGVNLSGVDFSLSALHTWNKMPAMSYNLSDDGRSLCVLGDYRRMTMIGADCSLPVGEFVVRGETAFYLDEAQNATLGVAAPQCDTYNLLMGLDWYPGNDWNLSAQYCHKYIFGNSSEFSGYRNSGLATARVSKELLQNTLKLSTFAYIDVTNGGVFNRLSASYSLNDQIELTAGYDFFHADGGMFQMYAHNSEVWVKAKYSF